MGIEWDDGMLDRTVSGNSVTVVAVAAVCFVLVGWVAYKLIVAPWRTLLYYRKQGLKGPPFKPLFWSLGELRKASGVASREPIPIEEVGYVEAVLPHVCKWMKRYAPGEQGLVYGKLTSTEVVLWDAELVREFFTKARCYKRDLTSRTLIHVFTGDGLVALDTGHVWAEQRKILNTGFRVQFLKGLHHHLMEASNAMVQGWVGRVHGCKGSAEIRISKDVKATALNIISRFAYGASLEGGISLETAQEAFHALDQRMTMKTMSKYDVKFNIPALGVLLQTEADRRAAREDKVIDMLMEGIVDARLQAVRQVDKDKIRGSTKPSGGDLLGIMIEAMVGGSKTMTKEQIVRECRTIFVAGHSTTSELVTWTLLLLAHHAEWQVKAREEVRRITNDTGILEADDINKLHIMGMILLEVLRLYPPATLVSREALVRHRLGHLDILPGTNVIFALPLLQLDEKYWDEPLVFRPERFERGIRAACLNHADAYFPFGGGPRICIGQNLALMEAKVLIASVLQRFTLQVSPRYQHAPGPVSLTSAESVLLLVKELQG